MIPHGTEFGLTVITSETREGLSPEADPRFMDSLSMIHKVSVRFYFLWDHHIEGDFISDQLHDTAKTFLRNFNFFNRLWYILQ